MSLKYEDLNVEDAKELLRQWRDNNERKSEDVVEIFDKTFMYGNKIGKLGNEEHMILEQVAIAALDCHNYEVADFCIQQLEKDFPDSLRVMRLEAMKLEALEKYDEAVTLLDAMIKRDETNAAPRKRKIAILKATSHQSAIEALVEYLKKFMCDVEAWQELCNLYLQVGNYSKAVFCAEELLLHQPHNHLFHQRVAEIRYTMGGMENLELSKSYYLQALKCNAENLRALFGLFLVTSNLFSQYKSSANASKRKEVFRISQWAMERIGKIYKHAGPGPIDFKHKRGVDSLNSLVNALAIN